jgi:hypothetical protein
MTLGPLRTEPETAVIAKAEAAMTDALEAEAQRADEPDPALAMLAQLAVRVAALEARLAVLTGSLGATGDSAPAVITDAAPNAPR